MASGYYGHSFPRVFIGTGSFATTGKTVDLVAGEIGLFDKSSYTALSVAALPAFTNKQIIIAQGSYHTRDSLTDLYGGLQESVKSRGIKAKFVTRLFKVEPKRPQQEVWSIGWDGITTCCPTILCDRTYTVRIEVQGDAALKLHNRNFFKEYSYETPCCDGCETCDGTAADPKALFEDIQKQIAEDPGMKNYVQASVMLDLATDPLTNVYDFSEFNLDVCDAGDVLALAAVQSAFPGFTVIRTARDGQSLVGLTDHTFGATSTYTVCEFNPVYVDTVVSGDVNPAVVGLNYQVDSDVAARTITVPASTSIYDSIKITDTGSNASVNNITIAGAHTATISTDDEIMWLVGDGAGAWIEFLDSVISLATPFIPANYTPVGFDVPADCETCPVGFTLNPVSFEYLVQRTLDGSEDLSTEALRATFAVAVRDGYDTTPLSPLPTPEFVSNNGSIATVRFRVGEADHLAGLTVPATDVLTFLGQLSANCTPAAGSPISWTEGTSKYKTSRRLCITIDKPCDGASRLTEVQNFLASETSILTGSIILSTVNSPNTNSCLEIIEITQINIDCLEDGCNFRDDATYTDVPSFEHYVWGDCPCIVETPFTGCVGLRLEAAFEEVKFGNCSFYPSDHYNLDSLRLTVSLRDDAEYCNSEHETWNVRKIQAFQQANGLGETVLRKYLLSNNYRTSNERFEYEPRMREVEDQQHLNVVDRAAYYKQITLDHFIPEEQRGLGMSSLNYSEQYCLDFFFPEGADTTAFEAMLETFVAEEGISIELY